MEQSVSTTRLPTVWIPLGLLTALMMFPLGCLQRPLQPLSSATVPDQWQAVSMHKPVPVQAWVDDFSSPHLRQLVEEALAHNHNLQQVAYRKAAAWQQTAIADSALWPAVSMEVERSDARTTVSGQAVTQTTYALAGVVSWELDVWGRIKAYQQESAYQAVAADADFRAAQLSLVADLLRQWFALLESYQQHQLAIQTLASFQDTLVLLEARYRVGLVEAVELYQARADVSQSESNVAQRQREWEVARRDLETVLGRYPSGQLVAEATLPDRLQPIPVGLPADLLLRRPDIQAAEKRLSAAGETLRATRDNRLPSIQLSASSGNSSEELRHLLSWDALVWRLVGGIVQPIFQGGQLKAAEALARLQRKEVWAAYAKVVQTAFQEVESALVADRYYQEQDIALRQAVKEADNVVVMSRSRYQKGLGSVNGLLERQRYAYSVASTLLRTRREQLNNRIMLHLALGGGFFKEEQTQHSSLAKRSALP